MKTLKISGTGWHCLTSVTDADTGENIGLDLGINRIEYHVGDKGTFPYARLIVELLCPVIIDIKSDPNERQLAPPDSA